MLIRERSAPGGQARSPWDPVDEALLRRSVMRLAVPRHRTANPRGNASVRDAIANALAADGYDVSLQGAYANVVALPLQRASITLVAAHYDSVPDCPGADDNASGLAVLLECARLARRHGARDLGFIAFNAEEDGLLGSRDFVTNGLPELGLTVRAIHVLEMVGYRGRAGALRGAPWWAPAILEDRDFLGLVAKDASNALADRVLAQPCAPDVRVVAAKTWGPMHRLAPDLGRSDHAPFWDVGTPALLWTDTGDFRNPHYHRASDVPQTLDYDFLRGVAELLCSTLAWERHP